MPGTHDTLTYDLSTTVSDGGDDGHPELSKIMHELPWLIPGSFIQGMAHTQVGPKNVNHLSRLFVSFFCADAATCLYVLWANILFSRDIPRG